LTSRGKYVRDPSVQSGLAYGQTGGMYGAQNNVNNYSQSYVQGPTPPAPQYDQFNTNPIQSQPTSSYMSFQSPPVQPLSGSGINVPPVEMGQPAFINPQRNPQGAPGWNDPPPLSSNRVPKARPQPKAEIAPVAPITHPLFGVDPNQGVPQNGYHQEPQQQMNYGTSQQSGMASVQFQPQPFQSQPTAPQSMYPSGSVPSQQFPTQIQYQNFNQASVIPQDQIQQAPVRQTPEPPKQKPALPEEYIYMQTVLDELKVQCINSATNPQTKRKLEDVGKRLEMLYDLLRENRLSQNTLASLNQLVQFIQVGDYANGLLLHTQMVSGTDFSAIASFMPGIKVLLQTAMQLQVYLR